MIGVSVGSHAEGDVGMATSAFSRDTDLTGIWSGEYWHLFGGSSTPFAAHITETAGSISGTTLEPATFGARLTGDLAASIEGTRGDLTVTFTKLYDRSPGVHRMPILYTGTVDAALTTIDGEWTFGAPGLNRGRFTMRRARRGAEKAERKIAEELTVGR